MHPPQNCHLRRYLLASYWVSFWNKSLAYNVLIRRKLFPVIRFGFYCMGLLLLYDYSLTSDLENAFRAISDGCSILAALELTTANLDQSRSLL